MSEHTLAVIVLILACMNEVRGLYEDPQPWTPGRVLIGLPMTIFVWWLALTVVL